MPEYECPLSSVSGKIKNCTTDMSDDEQCKARQPGLPDRIRVNDYQNININNCDGQLDIFKCVKGT